MERKYRDKIEEWKKGETCDYLQDKKTSGTVLLLIFLGSVFLWRDEPVVIGIIGAVMLITYLVFRKKRTVWIIDKEGIFVINYNPIANKSIKNIDAYRWTEIANIEFNRNIFGDSIDPDDDYSIMITFHDGKTQILYPPVNSRTFKKTCLKHHQHIWFQS